MASTTTFQYSVRDRGGKARQGQIEAETPAAVATKLKSMGYAPLEHHRVQPRHEARAIAAQVRADGQAEGPGDHVAAVRDDDQLGPVAAARARHPRASRPRTRSSPGSWAKCATTSKRARRCRRRSPSTRDVFPPLMVNMCRAGEVGGFLDAVLLQIAENYEAEVKLRSKIKSAMTYPVVVFCIAIVAVTGMLLFIVPMFAKMFSDARRRAAGADPGADLHVGHRCSLALRSSSSFGDRRRFVVWNRIKPRERVRNFVDPLEAADAGVRHAVRARSRSAASPATSAR